MKPQDNQELENALGQIAPGIPAALRDRMLFAAGQQAANVAHRQNVRWQLGATTAVTGLLTFALTWMSQSVSQNGLNDSLATNSSPPPTESSNSLSDNLTNKQNLPASHTEISTTARFFTLNDVFRDNAFNGEQVQSISNRTTLTPRSSLDL